MVLSVIFVFVCDRFDILWNINLTMVGCDERYGQWPRFFKDSFSFSNLAHTPSYLMHISTPPHTKDHHAAGLPARL